MIEDLPGGDPACWAHLGDDIGPWPLDAPDDGGPSGSRWHLPHGGDLDANLVHLRPGDSIGRHVNGELDVLVIVLDGTGEIEVDDLRSPVSGGWAMLLPRGSARRIVAARSGLTYMTVHRRRGPLTIGR